VAKLAKIAIATRNAGADAKMDRCNGGKLRLYGAPRPASSDDPPGAAVLLAELSFGNPAFGAAVNGVKTANAITGDSAADATGTAVWGRFTTSGGATVADGNAGDASDAPVDIQLNSKAIQIGATVNITSLTWTEPE
jgi:hypothetical protein